MKNLIALCFALVLTACATVHPPRPFDPVEFLKTLTQTGEGVCRLTNQSNGKVAQTPCKFFQDESGIGDSTFVALYHPQLGYLLAIKEIKLDGTQANVWNKPSEKQNVVPTSGGQSV